MDKENNLFSQKITISGINDIENAIVAVLLSESEYFTINVKHMPKSVFRFKNGRFDDEYLPVETLKIARIYRTNLKKYFKATLAGDISEDMIYFAIQRGSFEIDFQQVVDTFIKKAVGEMTGKQLTITILVALLAWTAKTSYSEYLDKQHEALKERLAAQNNQSAISALKDAIDALKANAAAASAKNMPPKKAIEMLREAEALEYGNETDTHAYTQNDAEKFHTNEEPHIRYETVVDNFYVKKISDKDGKVVITLKNGKYKTFDAFSKLQSNEAMLNALESGNTLKLKLSVGKDENSEIVEADIYEIVPNAQADEG